MSPDPIKTEWNRLLMSNDAILMYLRLPDEKNDWKWNQKISKKIWKKIYWEKVFKMWCFKN